MLGAPRTDPIVRKLRNGLLPRVIDGEPLVWPRMKDAGRREPGSSEFRHPLPRQCILLATPPKRAPPEIGDVEPECPECPGIRGHRVVGEVSRDHAPQPSALGRDGVVHAGTQLRLDLSRVGVIRPPGVGIYRPLGVAPKGISKHPVDEAILPCFLSLSGVPSRRPWSCFSWTPGPPSDRGRTARRVPGSKRKIARP